VDLDSRPILVFWESTRACLLACRHCRAEAQAAPVPGELMTEESLRFIDSLAAFERPAPILVITGGDALMRHDLSELVAHAREVGVPVALAPSVTPLLTDERLAELRRLGVKVASLSLDGASAATHEGIGRQLFNVYFSELATEDDAAWLAAAAPKEESGKNATVAFSAGRLVCVAVAASTMVGTPSVETSSSLRMALEPVRTLLSNAARK